MELTEVCGEPGGVIANPPAVDPQRRVVVGYDSGHGRMAAWRYHLDRPGLDPLWRRRQDHAGHMLRLGPSGQLLSYDYDAVRGIDQAVVLDIETGDELARVDTASPVQCVLFPCAGWSDDVYVSTFTTLHPPPHELNGQPEPRLPVIGRDASRVGGMPSPQKKSAAAAKPAMSASHKAALAQGRHQSRVVRAYLNAIENAKPRRSRARDPQTITNRIGTIDLTLASADPVTQGEAGPGAPRPHRRAGGPVGS